MPLGRVGKRGFAGTMLVLCVACRTVHFDNTTEITPDQKKAGVSSPEQEAKANADELRQYAIEEELKEIDVERTVIYIDRPVYSPVEKPEPQLKGAGAVRQSNINALQIPLRFVNGVMLYPWDDTFVYEIQRGKGMMNHTAFASVW